MNVLVDSSGWIQYFAGNPKSNDLDFLIDENQIVINEIILSELVPYLKIKNQNKIIALLHGLPKTSLIINWDEIITLQTKSMKKGHNGIGIPDIIIAQNAIQNNCKLFTLDGHFKYLEQVSQLKLYK